MNQFSRTELLFGADALKTFQNSRVAIMGLGGVGSYAAEALARSGIGSFLLVDFDVITLSNLNRQLPALHSTVGQLKTEAMRDRIKDINPKAGIEIYSDFCAHESRELLLQNLDFVIDAIDSLGPKTGLIEACYRKQIPIISAMGAASRFDPAQIELVDISQSRICPLAKKSGNIYTDEVFKKVFRLFILMKNRLSNLLTKPEQNRIGFREEEEKEVLSAR
jgi:tRNA threonylcarbamoyladenosine dehydratase